MCRAAGFSRMRVPGGRLVQPPISCICFHILCGCFNPAAREQYFMLVSVRSEGRAPCLWSAELSPFDIAVTPFLIRPRAVIDNLLALLVRTHSLVRQQQGSSNLASCNSLRVTHLNCLDTERSVSLGLCLRYRAVMNTRRQPEMQC